MRIDFRASILLGAWLCIAPALTAAPQSSAKNWDALVDDFFDQAYFKFNPTQGTSAGFHQYDSQLENYSHATVDQQIAALHSYEKRFSAFDAKSLDETQAADRELVLAGIRGTLLSLETIRPWEKNADTYSSGVTSSAPTLMPVLQF